MTQQPMTNEQIALRIASEKFTNSSDVIRIADRYYEWLESKRKEPGYDIFEAMEAKKLKNEGQMIKTIVGAAGIFIVINLFIYGVISFLTWNWDISTWTLDGRFFQTALGIIFGGGATSAYVMFKEEKNGQQYYRTFRAH